MIIVARVRGVDSLADSDPPHFVDERTVRGLGVSVCHTPVYSVETS